MGGLDMRLMLLLAALAAALIAAGPILRWLGSRLGNDSSGLREDQVW